MIIDTLMNFQLNIFAFILLAIMLFSLVIRKEVYKQSSKILLWIFVSIMIMLVIEVLSWLFDGLDGNLYYFLNYTFNLLFFLLGPAAAAIFAIYVDYTIYEDTSRFKKHFYYLHAFVFSLVLIVINFFTPIIFSVSENNVYQRETLMVLGFGAVYVLMIYSLVKTSVNRRRISTKALASIYIFLLLPFASGVLQMLQFGLSVMWAFMALGAVIAYIFTEMISTSEDFLTKASTRMVAINYMKHLTRVNVAFSLVWFDLDYFKEFNDKYGHQEGDEVLIHFVKLLYQIYPPEAIVSRFGGDEFFIVIRDTELSQLKEYSSKLREALLDYEEYPRINEVQVSVGIRVREIDDASTIDDILVDADRLMYANKAENKNLKRRTTDR